MAHFQNKYGAAQTDAYGNVMRTEEYGKVNRTDEYGNVNRTDEYGNVIRTDGKVIRTDEYGKVIRTYGNVNRTDEYGNGNVNCTDEYGNVIRTYGNVNHTDEYGNVNRTDEYGNVNRTDEYGNVICTYGNVNCTDEYGNVIPTDEYGNPIRHRGTTIQGVQQQQRHDLSGKLHRYGRSSSSEDDGQGGRINFGHKDHRSDISSATATTYNTKAGYGTGEQAQHYHHAEKKGMNEKIKEKLSGHHTSHDQHQYQHY